MMMCVVKFAKAFAKLVGNSLGKHGVVPWGLAQGSLGKYVLVCIVSFCFAEALLYNTLIINVSCRYNNFPLPSSSLLLVQINQQQNQFQNIRLS